MLLYASRKKERDREKEQEQGLEGAKGTESQIEM